MTNGHGMDQYGLEADEKRPIFSSAAFNYPAYVKNHSKEDLGNACWSATWKELFIFCFILFNSDCANHWCGGRAGAMESAFNLLGPGWRKASRWPEGERSVDLSSSLRGYGGTPGLLLIKCAFRRWATSCFWQARKKEMQMGCDGSRLGNAPPPCAITQTAPSKDPPQLRLHSKPFSLAHSVNIGRIRSDMQCPAEGFKPTGPAHLMKLKCGNGRTASSWEALIQYGG